MIYIMRETVVARNRCDMPCVRRETIEAGLAISCETRCLVVSRLMACAARQLKLVPGGAPRSCSFKSTGGRPTSSPHLCTPHTLCRVDRAVTTADWR